ncbi:hypothetical protein A6S26_17800 [Nostoc sp. ATCC 43529]|nr:hypothetical protein A6S26_17800 [Nostoc sp. ATCC 43529]
MPTNAATLPLKRQMERRRFLNRIASYEERPQTDNPLFIRQLRYLELGAFTVCNYGNVCFASQVI